MDLGVDAVKTGSSETFAQLVEMASPALGVPAGGPRTEAHGDLLHVATTSRTVAQRQSPWAATPN